MDALRGLALLLLFQAVGESIAHFAALPFPGPVIGLALLAAGLRWPALRKPVQAAAELLLGHLSLLFVPVGVGIITHLDVVASHGVRLLVVLSLSTWIGMAVTAAVLRLIVGRRGEGGAPAAPAAAPAAEASAAAAGEGA